jgi:Fe-S oxidoreductase
MFGDDVVQAFREFKAIWDPGWKMNPGKIVDPNPRTSDLRLGTRYDPWEPETYFKFPDDRGSFARAALRCVGVGECRRHDGGTMCPSYMALHEEEHTTRGRAHLLFEMLRGETIARTWSNEPVKDALHLCLSCKGCKGDCPVNVDMATYKAEFLAHYYEGRLRPRSAYAFGLVYWWARAASLAPHLVNFVTHAPGLSMAAKFIAGMAPEREVPRFAPRTFKQWFHEHERERAARGDANSARESSSRVLTDRVILWADTFNNHFFPETLAAAVEVLESAGVEVMVPRASLCCGRPLYDFGMLGPAKQLLYQILGTLRPDIEAGTPIVGLEPSCVAVFRDELHNLMPHDQTARRLGQQVFTLGEYLSRLGERYSPPKLERRAIVHGHCHQKAIMKMDGELRLLDVLGLDYTVLDSGCCGMAGSFGFEADKFQLSEQIGERVLLPAVRAAPESTLIVADGFSCREQISQNTSRRALHTAQVLQLALHEGRKVQLDGRPPELAVRELRPRALARPTAASLAITAAVGAGALLGGTLAWHATRGRVAAAREALGARGR